MAVARPPARVILKEQGKVGNSVRFRRIRLLCLWTATAVLSAGLLGGCPEPTVDQNDPDPSLNDGEPDNAGGAAQDTPKAIQAARQGRHLYFPPGEE